MCGGGGGGDGVCVIYVFKIWYYCFKDNCQEISSTIPVEIDYYQTSITVFQCGHLIQALAVFVSIKVVIIKCNQLF